MEESSPPGTLAPLSCSILQQQRRQLVAAFHRLGWCSAESARPFQSVRDESGSGAAHQSIYRGAYPGQDRVEDTRPQSSLRTTRRHCQLRLLLYARG